jgi:hypothetical protein
VDHESSLASRIKDVERAADQKMRHMSERTAKEFDEIRKKAKVEADAITAKVCSCS